MSGPSTISIVLTVALVAATQAGVGYVRAKYEPHVIRTLRGDLSELPTKLGDWQVGEDSQASRIDPKVLGVLGADHAVTRLYSNGRSQHCSVHIAVWQDANEWTPHPPELCYSGVGFNLTSKSVATLPNTEHAVRVEEFVAQNAGEIANVIYWYQIGDNTYYDRNSARPIRRKLWGKAERGPLIKVLLHANELGSDESRQSIMELAASIEEFAAGL